jgi:hypothetical protein
MEKKHWVGCSEANAIGPLTPFEAEQVVAMAVATTALADGQRGLILKHQALVEEAFRKLRAAHGICPDCGHPMDVDPACVVSDPPHGNMDQRTAPAAMCGNCDLCMEL